MGEIKTDMFPEVLRMRAKEKRENGKRNRQEDRVTRQAHF